MNRLHRLRALVYPRRCPFCDRVLGLAPECDRCRDRVRALELRPFRLSSEEYALPGLDGGAGVYQYEERVRAAILRMKYAGRACYGELLGKLMAARLFGCTFEVQGDIIIQTGAPPAALEYDMAVPVPTRNRQRGFNPPAVMAAPLAGALGLPLEPDALRKTRDTPRQEELDRTRRLLNLVGAFEADPAIVSGARVLLVDDVLTTGATAVACAAALRKAGAESVFVVSLAVRRNQKKEGSSPAAAASAGVWNRREKNGTERYRH